MARPAGELAASAAARAEVAVQRDRTRDTGVGLLEPGLETRVPCGERSGEGQVAPGGPADEEDLVGIGAYSPAWARTHAITRFVSTSDWGNAPWDRSP